ncbi:glycerol kinase [Fomitopsis serialis]|uniref:glycerol kinase n=1 Tax=Fomitopsis serialis TaxID=139415 RepID=UPI002007C216|nr:glycerol kinase [Neoantrodia serialis]KAH9933511.1 glycerol kinase [Neoantrodia serialis]
MNMSLLRHVLRYSPRLAPLRRSYSAMSSLKQGEFVGSLDCGTTSTRFLIFDQYANIVAQHQLEYPQYYPEPGWHEQDPDEIVESCDTCITEACKALETSGWAKESVKVIGITNQRETAVAWSRKTGKPLCRAIVWTDSRTKNTVAHFANKLSYVGLEVAPGIRKKGKEGEKALKDLTGLQLSTYFSAIKLRWMIEHHEHVRKAHEEDDLLFGTVESWLVYRLTGGLHVTEVTNASRTLLMNLRTLEWEPIMLNFLEIKPSVLPKIASSSEGVKIGGLVGDQQGALVGNKCLKQGEAKCTYGTGAFLLFCTGEDIVSSAHGLLSTVAYQDGKNGKPVYALEGSSKSYGVPLPFVTMLRDSMGLIKTAADINTLADSVKHTGGVYFVPAFSGLLAPYWDPGAGGLLIGLSAYTTPSHICRATLDANAFQTREILESMKLDSKTELKLLMVDGGMTNGDTAMQVLADVGGFTVVRPEMRESTALGSALLAGSAIRLFGWNISEPETLSEVNTKGTREFNPVVDEPLREKKWLGWKRAVERSLRWEEGVDE